MPNFISHQGNANENHKGYHFTPTKITNFFFFFFKDNNMERMWKNWSPRVLLVGM